LPKLTEKDCVPNSSLEASTAAPPETAPLRAALLAQLGGAAVVVALVAALSRLTSADFSRVPLLLALLQGGIAAAIALRQRVPFWWLPIHLAFVPLAVLVQDADITPGWFLAGFVLLVLVFWRTDKSRVPLYLSNRATAEALGKLLPADACRVLDIGCGDGGLVRRLARARPDCIFVGIEYAPLPWLLAKLRCLGVTNAQVRFGDFWEEPLADYRLVYAFLSPAPMPRLWAKASAEMTANTLLVSNSFAVPGVSAERIVKVADRRATRLYLYHPACPTDKADESAAFPSISTASLRQ
jgi:SAM-dependent methyltransferase